MRDFIGPVVGEHSGSMDCRGRTWEGSEGLEGQRQAERGRQTLRRCWSESRDVAKQPCSACRRGSPASATGLRGARRGQWHPCRRGL